MSKKHVIAELRTEKSAEQSRLDAEFEARQRIIDVLWPLTPENRERVLRAAAILTTGADVCPK